MDYTNIPWNIKTIDPTTNNESIVDVVYWTAMGVHSKIPVCCIAFWISTWIKLPDSEKVMFLKQIGNIELKNKIRIEYIPCPLCVTQQNFVKVHFCNKSKSCQGFNFKIQRSRLASAISNGSDNTRKNCRRNKNGA